MLLTEQRKAVERAWMERCDAQTAYELTRTFSNARCREYFRRPGSLVWPFAAGVLAAGFRRSSPSVIQTGNLIVSAAQLVSRALPLIRRLAP